VARAGPVLEQGLALEAVEQSWAREQEQEPEPEPEPEPDQERMEADLFIRGQGLPSIRVRAPAPVQLQAVELPVVVRGPRNRRSWSRRPYFSWLRNSKWCCVGCWNGRFLWCRR